MNKYKFYMDELKMGYDRTDFTIEAETYEEAQIKALEVFNMDVDLPAINSVMAIGDVDLVQPHMLSKPRVTRELFCVKDHIVSKDELISDNTPKIVEDETN